MKLSSTAFTQNGHIPSTYTCDGDNVSPPLKIEFIPALAKSLVLIMDDPDIPDYVKAKLHLDRFDHWVAFNIPTNTKEIPEDTKLGQQGRNSAGRNEYTGPCPPDREHRYFFKRYAIDTKLQLMPGASKAEVETAMKGHVVDHCELVGLYERKEKK